LSGSGSVVVRQGSRQKRRLWPWPWPWESWTHAMHPQNVPVPGDEVNLQQRRGIIIIRWNQFTSIVRASPSLVTLVGHPNPGQARPGRPTRPCTGTVSRSRPCQPLGRCGTVYCRSLDPLGQVERTESVMHCGVEGQPK
jgi:hypothetical protein